MAWQCSVCGVRLCPKSDTGDIPCTQLWHNPHNTLVAIRKDILEKKKEKKKSQESMGADEEEKIEGRTEAEEEKVE